MLLCQILKNLSVQIFTGEDKSQQVNVVLKENREMLESFSTITRELNNLVTSLSQAENMEPQAEEEILVLTTNQIIEMQFPERYIVTITQICCRKPLEVKLLKLICLSQQLPLSSPLLLKNSFQK